MPNIIFSLQRADEIEYLAGLEAERSWFIENDFPAILPALNADHDGLYEEHRQAVRAKLQQVRVAWRAAETAVFAALVETLHNPLLPVYHCHASAFGPEGKYFRPDWIFIRLASPADVAEANATIAHELIHLAAASDNHLSYREKEQLVDQITMEPNLHKFWPEYQPQSELSGA